MLSIWAEYQWCQVGSFSCDLSYLFSISPLYHTWSFVLLLVNLIVLESSLIQIIDREEWLFWYAASMK